MDLAVTHQEAMVSDMMIVYCYEASEGKSHILIVRNTTCSLLLVVNNVKIDCDTLHCHFQKKIFIILK